MKKNSPVSHLSFFPSIEAKIVRSITELIWFKETLNDAPSVYVYVKHHVSFIDMVHFFG